MASGDVRTNGRPVDEDDFEAGVRSYYDFAGPAYEQLMNSMWHHGDAEADRQGLSPQAAAEDMQRKIVAAARIKPDHLVLDFGSGVGGATVAMATATGARFVGVSNNAHLTARARELAQRQGVADRVFFHDIGDHEYRDLRAWPDGAFDAIVFAESVVHLPRKDLFFRAAHRVLAPGGHLVGIDWIQRLYGEYRTWEQVAQVMAPVDESICIPGHATTEDYHRWAVEAGFVGVRVRDLFPGQQCWGSTPEEDRPRWYGYDGPNAAAIHAQKGALDAAREAGVFSVALFIGRRPR